MIQPPPTIARSSIVPPPPGPRAKIFAVFEIPDFAGRMGAIRSEVSPWLSRVGETLAPVLAELAGEPIHAHVARHARRTVNPPADTWVAFGPGARGYKAERHFKVAVSRDALRLLFEIGPEYAEKAALAHRWRLSADSLLPPLQAEPGLAWFANEHDEAPAGLLAELSTTELGTLADRLEQGRDGQLVLGVAISRAEALRLSSDRFGTEVVRVFGALAHSYRVV